MTVIADTLDRPVAYLLLANKRPPSM